MGDDKVQNLLQTKRRVITTEIHLSSENRDVEMHGFLMHEPPFYTLHQLN